MFWTSCPDVRVKIGVVYFVGSMKVAIKSWWHVKFLFGGPKKLGPHPWHNPWC
jgi:hypothetical protein